MRTEIVLFTVSTDKLFVTVPFVTSDTVKFNACVAQQDRVSPSDGEGCGFDSRRMHQKKMSYFVER